MLKKIKDIMFPDRGEDEVLQLSPEILTEFVENFGKLAEELANEHEEVRRQNQLLELEENREQIAEEPTLTTNSGLVSQSDYLLFEVEYYPSPVAEFGLKAYQSEMIARSMSAE